MKRLALVPLVLLFGCKGCGRKPPEVAPVPLPPVVDAAPPPVDVPVAPVAPGLPDHVVQMARNFERVFFAFDASALNDEGKKALTDNIALMQQFPDVRVEVQGHADERGTTDYNLSLGQKRAQAVVSFMTASGIPASRVKVVSYGEERPLDVSGTERAWAQNRRAEFAITWDAGAPLKGSTP
jgi:peptidoglycan-associated lipoprotein